MMKSLMESETLKSYEHRCFNTSWRTNWDLAGKKNFNVSRVARKINYARLLMGITRNYKPHIIHFQCGSGGIWDFPGDMLMFWASKLMGAKTILHWHRVPSQSVFPGKSTFTKVIFDRTAGNADSLIVLSKRYKEELQNFVISEKAQVVPNAFEESLLYIPSPRPTRSRVNIIFIGRLTREKGIRDLIEVASIIVRVNSGVRFVLAGMPNPNEGGMAFLENLINKKGLQSHFQFVGSVFGEDKLAFFRDGDILLFPSYRESFGIAVLEAMASGLSTVAYSVDMLPDLINDSTSGFLVPPGDITGVSTKLLTLIEDPKLRAAMGQNGRDFVREQFSLPVVAEKVKKIYELIIDV
jgi:glycosyltransferase involved in cell wall biosynthesis